MNVDSRFQIVVCRVPEALWWIEVRYGDEILEAPRVEHSETVGSVKAVATQKRVPLIVAIERFGQKDHFVSEHRKRFGDCLLSALRQVATTILSPRQNF